MSPWASWRKYEMYCSRGLLSRPNRRVYSSTSALPPRLPPTCASLSDKAPSGSPGTIRGRKNTTVTEMAMVATKMISRSERCRRYPAIESFRVPLLQAWSACRRGRPRCSRAGGLDPRDPATCGIRVAGDHQVERRPPAHWHVPRVVGGGPASPIGRVEWHQRRRLCQRDDRQIAQPDGQAVVVQTLHRGDV